MTLDPKTVALAALGMVGTASAQVTELVSVDSSGIQANYNSIPATPAKFVSADGRFVVFMTDASNLVPGDMNGTWDIFVRDRLLRTTERATVSASGVEGNGASGAYGFSAP